MKTLTIIAITFLSNSGGAQSISWYPTPDGTSAVWGDWAYKDIYIPAGQQVDSVYGAFQRPGYPADAHDYIFSINSGPIYDGASATSPWDYLTETNSLYGYWINLTSYNYIGEGVVRIGLPTPAGAIWDSVGIATSAVSGAGLKEIQGSFVSVYPNPVSNSVSFRSNSLEELSIMDLLGNIVLSTSKKEETMLIDVSELPSGTYLIRQGQSVVKFTKN